MGRAAKGNEKGKRLGGEGRQEAAAVGRARLWRLLGTSYHRIARAGQGGSRHRQHQHKCRDR